MAEPNLSLPDAANFLDAGLTALGLVSALLTTILRGRLDAENNTRDLLTYIDGQILQQVTILAENQHQHQHSLSKALLVVEEKAVEWAQQLFSYYGVTSGKSIDLLIARWLHPDNYPPALPVEVRCRCSTQCKCLLWKRVDGVTEHLVSLANGVIFRLDDQHDAVICAGCRHNNCHGFNNVVYQLDVVLGVAIAGSRLFGTPVPEAETFIRSVADLYVVEEGNTGLIMLEPADEESVHWASTILEASVTKDSAERGSENPFTVTYTKAVEGEQEAFSSTGRDEYPESSWWLSRLSAMAIASTLTVVFRTDAFSSVLLARRGLRGYISDRTGAKLPLQTFCSVAQSYGTTEGSRRASVVLKPKSSFTLHLPSKLLGLGAVFELFVLILWITALVMTPWLHPVGSSYLYPQPLWATFICAIFASLASSLNVVYYCCQVVQGSRCRWAKAGTACGVVDAAVVCLAIMLGMRYVSKGHWVQTSFRVLMMIGALLQWYLGVLHLGSLTTAFRGAATLKVIPYSLTFFRLLALLLGAGRWA